MPSRSLTASLVLPLALLVCGHPFAQQAAPAAAPTVVNPAKMTKLATVDPRFVSYNVEMVEVTGGRFWKPYNADVDARLSAQSGATPDPKRPIEMDPNLFQYRSPINLANPRLRKLAEALGPAYIRVSGTWQNSTFFQNDYGPQMKEPPKGFNSVLTRAEWKGVVDFAHAVGAEIVTSVATSAGTRKPMESGHRPRQRRSWTIRRASEEASRPPNS